MAKEIDQKNSNNGEIVVWCDKYATGIPQIDEQHHHLVNLTNQLYAACFAKEDVLHSTFKDAMSRMVEYVRFHFDAESKLLHEIKYPDYPEHKKMHDTLINKILEAAKSYDGGKKFVPNNFVRTLVDWVFSHIAVYDKRYSAYAMDRLKNGFLTLEQLKAL